MIHPLGYWWRRRAAQRQEERRRANVPKCTWPSTELRDRYLRYQRVLTMREAGLKLHEIAGYMRVGDDDHPITPQGVQRIYVAARAARERGLI